MTERQQQALGRLQDRISPLFWAKGLKLEYHVGIGPVVIKVEVGKGIFAYLLRIDSNGVLSHVLPTTIESAIDLLQIYQADWERSKPEMIRETGWVGGDGLVTVFAGVWLEVRMVLSIPCWSLSYAGRVITSGSSGSVEAAKEAAIEALIAHLKQANGHG